MQPSAYLVNTSRGEVIDEEALAALLESGHIAGAGLDVYADEANITPSLIDLAECGAAAAYRLGHHRGPARNGRQGHHQYPDILGRPCPA